MLLFFTSSLVTKPYEYLAQATMTKLLLIVVAVFCLVGTGCNSNDIRLTVDDDRAQCRNATYTNLQAAVDAAGPEETIQVCPGLYTGTVVIPATRTGLMLIGSGGTAQERTGDPSQEAILDGSGLDALGFVVQANDVTLQGFTVRNTGPTGIEVMGDGGSTISGVTISGNLLMYSDAQDPSGVRCTGGRGINVETALAITVTNNVVLSPCDAGIRFNAVTASTMQNNEVNSGRQRPGIAIRGASLRNVILGNVSQNNREGGISVQENARDNRIEGNTMRNNGIPGMPLRAIPGPGSNTDADDTTNLPLTNPPVNIWLNNDCLTENRPGLCQAG